MEEWWWVDASLDLPGDSRRVLAAVQLPYGGRIWRTVAEYVRPRTQRAEEYCDYDCDPAWYDTDDDGIEWTPAGWYEQPLTSDYCAKLEGVVLWWCELPELPEVG